MVISNSYQVNTGSNASQFIINSAFTPALHSSSWCQAMGSPSYFWNDLSPKLTYRGGEWDWTNRNTASVSSSYDSCISGSPCSPSVVCFSPSGEQFKNGITTWFPTGSFTPDIIYGNLWQKNVEFGILDPLYQSPKCPPSNLGVTVKCAQDNGSCPDDAADESGALTYYYKQPTYVEAMLNTASMSPPLPSGVTWPSMVMPPQPGLLGYYFHNFQQPWEVAIAQANECGIGSTCRFC